MDFYLQIVVLTKILLTLSHIFTQSVFMKKEKWIFCLLLLVLPCTMVLAQDQDDEEETSYGKEIYIERDHDRHLKLYPLHAGEIHLGYEKMRAARVSNEVDVAYVYRSYLKSDDFFLPEEKKVKGMSVRLSQRHFTSKKRRGTPFGFFHGPMFGYRYLAFEDNAFELPELSPSDPDYRYVGQLTQHSIDLSYQLGWQFKLSRHFTTELSLAMGARAKYAKAVGAAELLGENIIGHVFKEDDNSAMLITPVPQLKFAVGYSF
ncbi:ABC transporter ATP-binding protein [Pontibacter arcticus]|uniref:ABC transporter ATP-binding protein n=2 Tax=Pontibacter arcticus TaxID=2080288 RepID=A0A364RIS4_9BACT|nr:ABC transporter ATP-binding protein [Pontibacter arcticus]